MMDYTTEENNLKARIEHLEGQNTLLKKQLETAVTIGLNARKENTNLKHQIKNLVKSRAKIQSSLEYLNLNYFNLKGSETIAIMARDDLENKNEALVENLGDADVEIERLKGIMSKAFFEDIYGCAEIIDKEVGKWPPLKGNKHD